MKTMQDLFAHIHLMAKNSADEIYPRHIWRFLDENPEYNIKQVVTIKEMADQSCAITTMGISAALAGANAKWSKISKFDQFLSNFYKICSKDSFFIYDFEIGFTHKHAGSDQELGGHQFLVIQYKNTDNENCYSFFQSYFQDYTLETFLTKAAQETIKQHFTHEEFIRFLAELDAYIASGEGNPLFYNQYFQATEINYRDFPGKISKKLYIYATPSSLQKAELASDTFQEYKNSARYPEFIFVLNKYAEYIQLLDEKNDGAKKECLIDTPACFESRSIAQESLARLVENPCRLKKNIHSHAFYQPHQKTDVDHPEQDKQVRLKKKPEIRLSKTL